MDEFIYKIKRSGTNLTKADLLPLLQKFQNEFGYINNEFIDELSKIIEIPAGKIYGIATFYNQFRFKPRGKIHIEFCDGASCHIMVKEDLKLEVQSFISEKSIDKKDLVTIDFIPCMGACAKGPVIAINGTYYTKVSLIKLKKILNKID